MVMTFKVRYHHGRFQRVRCRHDTITMLLVSRRNQSALERHLIRWHAETGKNFDQATPQEEPNVAQEAEKPQAAVTTAALGFWDEWRSDHALQETPPAPDTADDRAWAG